MASSRFYQWCYIISVIFYLATCRSPGAPECSRTSLMYGGSGLCFVGLIVATEHESPSAAVYCVVLHAVMSSFTGGIDMSEHSSNPSIGFLGQMEDAQRSVWSDARRVAVACAFICAMAFLPTLTLDFPPLVDYPNHLARIHIFRHYSASAELQTYYLPVLSAQPNLAMDLIVLPLAQLVSLQLAGKIFICLTLAVVLTGTVVLHRTLFQHWSLWPLAAALFLYN